MRLLVATCYFFSACTYVSSGDFQSRLKEMDNDGDGYVEADDCDDLNADINPGVLEIWYDDIDQDCSNDCTPDDDPDRIACQPDFDADEDGYYVGIEGDNQPDCWDDPDAGEGYQVVAEQGFEQPDSASVYPGAEDSWYDGVDSD